MIKIEAAIAQDYMIDDRGNATVVEGPKAPVVNLAAYKMLKSAYKRDVLSLPCAIEVIAHEPDEHFMNRGVSSLDCEGMYDHPEFSTEEVERKRINLISRHNENYQRGDI